MSYLFGFLFLVYLCVSAVLVLVVLVQSGKGGGLSGLVGSGTSLGDTLGATGAEKTLNKWTTYCAIAFIVVNISLVLLGPSVFNKTILDEVPEGTPVEAPVGDGSAGGAPSATPTPVATPAPSSDASAPAPGGEAGAPAEGGESGSQ